MKEIRTGHTKISLRDFSRDRPLSRCYMYWGIPQPTILRNYGTVYVVAAEPSFRLRPLTLVLYDPTVDGIEA